MPQFVMNLIEFHRHIESIIEIVRERGDSPEDIPVTLQLEGRGLTVWGDEGLEVIEDNNGLASGCVIRVDLDGELWARVRPTERICHE